MTGHTNSYTPFRLTGLLPGVWDIIAVGSDANGNFPGHVATHYHEVFNVRETVYIPTPTTAIDVGLMVVPLTPVGPGTPVQTTDN